MEKDYKDSNRSSFRSERSSFQNNRESGRGERRERSAYGENRERQEYNGNRSGERPVKRIIRRNEEGGERNFNRDTAGYGERGSRQTEGGQREFRPRRPFQENRPYQGNQSQGDRPHRENNPYRENRPYREEGNRSDSRPRRFTSDRSENHGNEAGRERNYNREQRPYDGNYQRSDREQGGEYKPRILRPRREISGGEKEELRQKHYSKKKILAHRLKQVNDDTDLRLNRYISMGGVCSRRDADELIKTGRVKVNGEIVLTVGVKVKRKDQVEVDDMVIIPEKKVYLVLNKPKDYVTTVDDPLERKTVMTLVEGACKERVYPVGRLDRQTTGVLLFTNDGDLAKKLTHPKYDHKKIYHVFLDKPVKEEDLNGIAEGVELEDGFIKPDEVSYASSDCTEVGVEIHSGKNRIVRRIFEHFGYQIIKLDRVYFAGITKKNVPRGKWRFLTSQEVSMLKVY